MGGKDPFIVCADVARPRRRRQGRRLGRVPERRPGLHLRERFYVMADVYDDYLSRASSTTRRASCRRPDRPADRHRPDGLGPQRAEGRRPRSRPPSPPARRGRDRRRRWPGSTSGPLLLARGRHRRPGRDRPARAGDLRPGAPIVPVASLDEAIELANSTRFGLGANIYTRTSRRSCAACARSRPARSGSTTR